MPTPSLETLLLERRVLVVAGAGGVGKTTVAAALSLSAAERGRRVLCLTVDPSRRLADRLGLDPKRLEEQRLDLRPFEAEGLSMSGSVTVMMLDTKHTFDDLVRRHAPSQVVAERILANEFYEYVSTQLAGTQAYMAMEKVLGVLSDPRFDLLILDTPPTTDALDFLDAPERLIEALDSPALRWLADAFERSGRLSLSLVAQGVAVILRSVARLTGRGFLERLAEFVTEVNQLFGGFRERARRVAEAFRADDFAYVLVATPAASALREARFFAERLQGLGMRADCLILNRVTRRHGRRPSIDEVREGLGRRGLSGADLSQRVLQAFDAEKRLPDGEASAMAAETTDPGPLGPAQVPCRVKLPALADRVHDAAALATLCRHLGPS